MYYFTSDYTEGGHPELLRALTETNMEQTSGYGIDPYCEKATALIKADCKREDIDVHFFVGGTQTNLNIICAALRPFQGVYGAVPSHINTHEAGAIERTGHKVLELPAPDGKLYADQIEKAYLLYHNDPNREHWVQPKMVYISQPTEIGSMYQKKELEALHAVCKKYGMYLFIDGARLGYALTAPDNDTTMADIANNCDVFCIGGTKCGALFGEAAVIINPAIKPDFRSIMKQGGAVLAKGRLLGVQFATLFTDNLYYKICQHGIDCAMEIKAALTKKGIKFLTDSTTNQQFPIFTKEQAEIFSKDFVLAPWEAVDDTHMAFRICTGWATSKKEVIKLIALIDKL